MESSSASINETDVTGYWWVVLGSGIIWLIISLVVLQFDSTSVSAIGLLAGLVFIGAGLTDFIMAAVTDSYRWLFIVLGTLLTIAGIVALIRPEETFALLALVIGWFLLFKGTFDIITSLMQREYPLWWITLVVGIAEVLLAFWATGNFTRSAALLIVFVAASALARGITHIVMGVRLHELHKAAA